jgi:hypothetical protein
VTRASLDDVTSFRQGICQAAGCGYPVCFHARVAATAGNRQVRRSAGACGRHLGDLVQILTAWARDSGLTEGQVTILAVDPAAERRRHGPGGLPRHVEPGFAFSTIKIPQKQHY